MKVSLDIDTEASVIKQNGQDAKMLEEYFFGKITLDQLSRNTGWSGRECDEIIRQVVESAIRARATRKKRLA